MASRRSRGAAYLLPEDHLRGPEGVMQEERHISAALHENERNNTHHELALSVQGAGADPLEAVIRFATAERRTVYVCCEKTDGGEYAGIERGL